MKSLNWGKSILAVYIGFVLLMMFMVYMASRQDFDLVSKDYYQQEIAYQTKIDANKNQINSNNTWQIKSSSTQIEISLANFTANKKPIGKIEFYRPSNSKLDVIKELDLNAEGKMFFSTQNFKTGPYLIKINYTIENKNYFEQINYYHN
ncbi:MAG: FixH family protein [Bacteroidota bacterium]|jgi:hypothetical protein